MMGSCRRQLLDCCCLCSPHSNADSDLLQVVIGHTKVWLRGADWLTRIKAETVLQYRIRRADSVRTASMRFRRPAQCSLADSGCEEWAV